MISTIRDPGRFLASFHVAERWYKSHNIRGEPMLKGACFLCGILFLKNEL